MVFISKWASRYTTSDIQRFDNHCENHSALEVVYNAPIAIRYSVTRALLTATRPMTLRTTIPIVNENDLLSK